MGCSNSLDGSASCEPASQPEVVEWDVLGTRVGDKKPSRDAARKRHKKDIESAGLWEELGRTRDVMGRYTTTTGIEDIVGEGKSSVCRRGFNLQTGGVVAIKMYAPPTDVPNDEEIKLRKFKRQVLVLEKLQQEFEVPEDRSFWSEHVARSKPSRLFMILIDYSRDEKGLPGPDPSDDTLYIVSELGHYSLKGYIETRRDQNRPLPQESVRSISKAVLLIAAGLHAKGLVHIDLKPENLMMFGGRLKLMNVDGCVRIGTAVSISDPAISFSPCYCAPEWAKFLIKDSTSKIKAVPSLDVWSVGMTVCELVTLDVVLKPKYVGFLRSGHAHREAGFLFMEWLSCLETAPLPRIVERYADVDFAKFLRDCLLVADPKDRKTAAMSLSHPFMASARITTRKESEHEDIATGNGQSWNSESSNQLGCEFGHRETDATSGNVIAFKGTLWKLNADGNPQEPEDWLELDMWIAGNGSLCCFNFNDSSRVVLFDRQKLKHARCRELEDVWHAHAFELTTPSNEEDGTYEKASFAASSKKDKTEWMMRLQPALVTDDMPDFQLGDNFAEEVQTFRVNVHSRRKDVEPGREEEYAPVFKAILWKVRAEGDRMMHGDWSEREMWLSKNSCLVYFSNTMQRNLVYYTKEDLANATYVRIANDASAKEWAFQICLAGTNGAEFAPGEFAAESEAMREKWLAVLEDLQTK